MIKKIFSLLLGLCMVFGLSACGEKQKTVAVLYYDVSDIFISEVRSKLDEQLEAAGIAFTNYDGANDQSTQLEQVETALSGGFDVLVVNLVNASSDAAEAIVELAAAQEVPVVFFNRSVPESLLKDDVLFIGANAEDVGHLQGKMIGEYIVAHYDEVDLNGDGVVSYAMLKGMEGSDGADARAKYCVEGANAILAAAGKSALKFYNPSATPGVDGQYYEVDPNGMWSAAAGQEIITRAIQRSEDMIELVIAPNDGMAEGAITALQLAGYNLPDHVTIPVFGVDATDRARELIQQGVMTGTIGQNFAGMAAAIRLAAANGLADKALNDGIAGTTSHLATFYSDSNSANKIYVPYICIDKSSVAN